MTALLNRIVGIAIVISGLCAAPVCAEVVAPSVADLNTESSLQAKISPEREEFTAYLDETCARTGMNVIILGFDGSAVSLGAFRDRPASEFLQAIATRYKTPWRKYNRFLLLYPTAMERHDAKPQSRVDTWKELGRRVSGVFSGEFMGVVQSVADQVKVGALPVGPGATRGAIDRSFFPCTLVTRDCRLDDVFEMLTTLTGDPWDYWHDTHLLCFNGRPLTGEQRRLVEGTIATVQLRRSVSGTQRRLVDTEAGLQYSDLTLGQKSQLAAATVDMRARSGASADRLVLRRTPSAPHLGPNQYVDVYVRTPGGLLRLGSMRFF